MPAHSKASLPARATVQSDRGGKKRADATLMLRSELGMNRETFSRMIPISIRSLAAIEGGGNVSEAVQRRLNELGRIIDALSDVVVRAAIGEWLRTPNPAFDGLKPLEVIERGEIDRIWQMIYLLRSGTPG